MAAKLIALVALLGTSAHALTTASGRAIVVNKCSYDVYLNNVPAANEGGSAESKTLHTGDSYSQEYTGLSSANGLAHDGWSIKLSKTDGSNQVMQYEYTWQPTGLFPDFVWFDMSYVNGDPFNGDWSFTSNNATCQSQLTHNAYANPTDDVLGMQKPCDCSDDVTLTLCQMPGSLGSSSSSAVQPTSTSTSAPASTSTNAIASSISSFVSVLTSAVIPATTSSAAPVTTSATSSSKSSTTSAKAQHTYGFGNHEFVADVAATSQASSAPSVSPTTFATSVSSVAEFYGQTITEVETAWVTSFVTADGPEPTEARKRHEHHAAHHHA